MNRYGYLLVLSTTSSEKEARQIASLLLKKRLAACVNISPFFSSRYRWKGKIEHAREVLLFIKTKQSAFKDLEKTLRSHHSYSVPEIIAVPIRRGSRDYLAWLAKEMR